MKQLTYRIPTLLGWTVLTEQQAKAYASICDCDESIYCEVYDGDKLVQKALLHDLFRYKDEENIIDELKRRLKEWRKS